MKKEKGTNLIMSFKMFMITLLSLFCTCVFATPKAHVFVSFSMPERLLQETLKESVRYNIPTYLNGLHQNSMKDTIARVGALTKAVPDLNLQIDPTAFERFGILQVPALVVEKDGRFDVIYGNFTLREAINRIAHAGDTKLTRDEIKEIISE